MQTDVQGNESNTLQSVLHQLQRLADAQEKNGFMNKELWSVAEIAEYMDLSPKSVSNLVTKHKTFPKCRNVLTGGRRWYSKEVRAWVEKQRPSND